jgi:hypothetical protein
MVRPRAFAVLKDDRDALRRPLDRERDRGAHGDDHVNLLPFEAPRRRLCRLHIALAVADVEDALLAFREPRSRSPSRSPSTAEEYGPPWSTTPTR